MSQSLDQTTPLAQPPPPEAPTAPPAPPPAAAPSKPTKQERPRKVYDSLLDAWYYNEINKRANEDPELFKNYQINPYTKKTLAYVTPKITERRRPLPKEPPNCNDCNYIPDENTPPLTEEEKSIIESYKLVKRAMDRSVAIPQCKFCEPQTEAMRLGWFPPKRKPPTNLQCMYIKTCWSPTPCCYFHPKKESPQTQDEQYDERFRAVHQTAEFIRTATKLRQFDAIMNPDGYRGQLKTERKRPK